MTEDVLHNRSVIALLEKLGLSRNEVKCYLASFTLGSATVSEVAKAAHVNRVNAYGAIQRLGERGLLDHEMVKKGLRVRAANLDHLVELAHDHQKRATKLRWRIEDIVPALLVASANHADHPALGFAGVSVLRGEEGFERIAERSLSVPRGSTNYYIKGVDFFHPESNPHYDEEYYIPTRIQRGIYSRSLEHPNAYSRRLYKFDKKEMRESRFLPAHIKFPCAILIYGDEVAFIWRHHEEIVGIAGKGMPLVAVMKMLFDMAWEMAGKGKMKNVKPRTRASSVRGG